MKRRSLLKVLGGGAAFATASRAAGQAQVARATRGMPSPKIKDVQVIATAPAGLRLTVVKIMTDQDGLYGYGCGTFTQRADLVNAAVERYLKPFLVGKPADRIDDTWQACYNSSYWRNGPVLNNAISGVDQALWDIKGRQAGMPVYSCWAASAARRRTATRHAAGAGHPAAASNRRASSWTRDSATCACRWACRAWRATARAAAPRRSRRCTKGRCSSRRRSSATR